MERSYNPIRETIDKPRFGLFKPREAPGPGLALVLHREGRPLAALRQPEERMTVGEAIWGNFLKIYKVDTSEHTLELQCRLPADTDAFDFFATVHLTCAVTDPTLVVERGIRDVCVAIEPMLVDVMRQVSRRFRVEESADAERDITIQLRQKTEAADFCPGFRIRGIAVRLELEGEARKHVRDLKEAARRHIEEMEHLRQDRERVKLQGEVESLKAQINIERSQQFLPLIQEGNWSMLALYLAGDPDRASEVINVMMSQQHLMLDKQIEALTLFLDKDVVEPSDFEERGRQLLRTALDQLGTGSRGGGAGISPNLLLTGSQVKPTPGEPKSNELLLEGMTASPEKVPNASDETEAGEKNGDGS